MGRNHSDELYTPKEAFEVLAPYLPKAVILEGALGTGRLKAIMEQAGFEVRGTDNYQAYEGEYDVMVTNPPFSKKDMFLAEAYKRGKPFAMLLPITALEGIKRQKLYQKYGIQILLPKRRTDFNGKKSPWFYVAWFCWKLLPQQMIFIQELKGQGE